MGRIESRNVKVARSTGGAGGGASDVGALLRVGATSLGTQDTPTGTTSKGRQHSDGTGETSIRSANGPVTPSVDVVAHRRRLVADLCRLVGQQLDAVRREAPVDALGPDKEVAGPPAVSGATKDVAISPRARQVLTLLLDGASEKQIARQLKLSQHTVHHHVKAIYRAYDVASRGELLARCLKA